jgi:hypothetical protein
MTLMGGTQHVRVKKLLNDTAIEQLKKFQDNPGFQKAYDSIEIRQNIGSQVQELIDIQKQNTARQKRGAYVRIGIGVAMLIVLVIGLSRRKKTTA